MFCSATAPVNQAAGRIIFSKNEDGSVTAVVQIQYQGPSEEFAWVLPVPGIPEVNVSSDLAFARVLALSTSGAGTVVTNNAKAIDEALTEHNATVASPGWGCGVVSPR
ncbi:MAG: DUF2330 domain-containing protein, partial [Polyangiales bacterium]